MAQTTTNKFVVTFVSESGAKIAANGKTDLVDWSTLRSAAEQTDPELRALYSELLGQAERMVCNLRPARVIATEINTNVYGVVGIGIDGKHRHVGAYGYLRLTNDQRLESYRLRDAEEDAIAVRKTNQLR